MSPQISIIIVNYNQEKYLRTAITSVLSQTWTDFELLIWDDGSTDASVAIAYEFALQDRRVLVIEGHHQGIAEARKAALQKTTGTYIGWVDSDDVLAPTALAETVAVLNQNPEFGMVYTDYLNIDAVGKIIGVGHRCQIPYSKDRLLVDFMTFHFRLIRRSIYEQVGGINPVCIYAYDYDLCLRISEVTEIYHLKQPLYFYRTHVNNLSKTRVVDQILWSQWAIATALKRRGLDDQIQIDVEIQQIQFVLRQKESSSSDETASSSDSDCSSSIDEKNQKLSHDSDCASSIDNKNKKLSKKKVIRSSSFTPPSIPGLPPGVNLKRFMCWGLFPLLLAMNAGTGFAQQIIPATDTNTIVTPNGNRIDISGGATSQDGANLFHSFSQFGVPLEQIANFQSNSNIQNILGRVTGGNPSIINGLIQVTGGNANLFLMNPSGFVFGANATLNVPAGFTATTATGIGFDNRWFSAIGTNNYSTLVGNPSAFAFNVSQTGAIVNLGNLTVGNGQSLNLLAGNIINTRVIQAPGGQIVVSSVPGQNYIRLSQPGNLLSLEVQPLVETSSQPNNWTLPIASLPELLTIGNVNNNSGIQANSDGTVELTNSSVKIPVNPGTTIISGNLNTASSTTGGGTINILGKQVGLVGTHINASGTNGGGSVKIGGDLQGKGTLPNANQTYVDGNSVIQVDALQNGNGGKVIVWGNDITKFFGRISARGGQEAGNGGFVEVSGKNFLTFDGQVDTDAPKGNFGTLLLDPSTLTIVDAPAGSFDATAGNILSATPDNGANTVSWGAIRNAGSNINLQATGNITINPITGATPGVTSPGIANLFLGSGGSFNITSTNGAVIFANLNDTIRTNGGAVNISGTSLSLGNFDTGSFSRAGNVTLSAIGDIRAGNIIARGFAYGEVNGGNIRITSDAGAITLGNINTSAGLSSSTGTATAGDITLSAANGITVGDINARGFGNGYGFGYGFGYGISGGDVNLTSRNSSIAVGNIDTSAASSTFTGNNNAIAGNVTLSASGDITIDDIIATGVGYGEISGGNVNVKSTNGLINLGVINTSAGLKSETIENSITFVNFDFNSLSEVGEAGDITLEALGNITLDELIARGFGYGVASGGNVNVSSTQGAINSGNINTSAGSDFEEADAGDIKISAFREVDIDDIVAVGFGYTAGVGGDVTVTSQTSSIILGKLDTSAASSGSATGGDIEIDTSLNTTSTPNDITISSIKSDALALPIPSGEFVSIFEGTFVTPQAGQVTIKTSGSGTVKVTDTINNFLRNTASISAASVIFNLFTTEFSPAVGTTNQITVQHGGGKTNVPFTVGNASVNGTAGAIDTGTSRMTTGSFSVLPKGGIADGTGGSNPIQIVSVNTPPTLTANTLLPKTEANQSVTLTFADLVPIASDIDNDVTSIVIDKVNVGTLTVNGVAVIPGVTTIKEGDVLVYTSPQDSTGLLNAFTISASDKVSFSEAKQIAVNINPLPEPDKQINIAPCSLQCEENPGKKKKNEDKAILPSLPTSSQSRQVLETNPTPEDKFTNSFTNQLGISAPLKLKTIDDAKNIAADIEKATGVKPAFVYMSFVPVEIEPNSATNNNKSSKQSLSIAEQNSDELEIVIVTAKGNPIRKRISGANRALVLETAQNFRDLIASRKHVRKNTYLKPSQQLYQWIVAPMEADLQTRGINNLVFLPDAGLRSTPMAALHSGKEFLIEKYSVGLMPSLSLTNTLYSDIKNSQVLAMGVSQSTQGQIPLPAVPQELSTLVFKLWQGKLLLNEQATFSNLKTIRRSSPFGIIHMATHADFTPGPVSNSYIQLWEDKLRLNQIRQLGLNNPQVEMMVLSACRTALGDEEAEIGFAGLAIMAGVKTSVASLWTVDDAGTAGLMTTFYENLKKAPIRAEALRQAQMLMAKGQVFVKNGQIQGFSKLGGLPLPTNSQVADGVLSHPYYWASFTMVGNPW